MLTSLAQQLEGLGLNQREVQILAVLAEHSPASATMLAKSCAMSRSSVYTLLSALISKGFVATTYKNDVKQFTVCDFSAIEQYVQHEKDNLEKKILTLQSLKESFELFTKKEVHVPQIIFFEGIVGLKHIYNSLLRTAEPSSTMYVMRDETTLQPEWKFIFEEHWQRLKREKNIKTVLLLNKSLEEQKKLPIYQKFFKIETKFLPTKYPLSQFTIIAMGDIVCIISFENNLLVGIKITNEYIAKNFEQIFKIILNQK